MVQNLEYVGGASRLRRSICLGRTTRSGRIRRRTRRASPPDNQHTSGATKMTQHLSRWVLGLATAAAAMAAPTTADACHGCGHGYPGGMPGPCAYDLAAAPIGCLPGPMPPMVPQTMTTYQTITETVYDDRPRDGHADPVSDRVPRPSRCRSPDTSAEQVPVQPTRTEYRTEYATQQVPVTRYVTEQVPVTQTQTRYRTEYRDRAGAGHPDGLRDGQRAAQLRRQRAEVRDGRAAGHADRLRAGDDRRRRSSSGTR